MTTYKKYSYLNDRVTWYFSPLGAHVKLPGFLYTRYSNTDGWSIGKAWRFFGLIAIRYNDTLGGKLQHVDKAGWSVRFARLEVQFIRADNYVS